MCHWTNARHRPIERPLSALAIMGGTHHAIPYIQPGNGEVDVLTSVIGTWCQINQIDPESECARAVTATALDLMEAGFRTRQSLSIAFANTLHPNA